MAQVTRLGLGGYSTANLWPSGVGGNNVDLVGALPSVTNFTGDVSLQFIELAGALPSATNFTGDVGNDLVLAGALPSASTFAGNLDVSAAVGSAVDLAGALPSVTNFTGNADVIVSSGYTEFAGGIAVTSAIAGDFTGNVTDGSKYGLGPYGAGPYSALGPTHIVGLSSALAASASLSGDLEVTSGAGWRPVAPCAPSMWTPVPSCDEVEMPELVE